MVPSRLTALHNANCVLHVGLHVFHAKLRADVAWPLGRGIAACAHDVRVRGTDSMW